MLANAPSTLLHLHVVGELALLGWSGHVLTTVLCPRVRTCKATEVCVYCRTQPRHCHVASQPIESLSKIIAGRCNLLHERNSIQVIYWMFLLRTCFCGIQVSLIFVHSFIRKQLTRCEEGDKFPWTLWKPSRTAKVTATRLCQTAPTPMEHKLVKLSGNMQVATVAMLSIGSTCQPRWKQSITAIAQ